MKTISSILSLLSRFSLIVSVASLVAMPNTLLAQEKGGERLMKLHRTQPGVAVQTRHAAEPTVMSCPKCKDTWVTQVRPTGKASSPAEVKTLARHECPGCHTRIVTQGMGKAAKSQVVHGCNTCGTEGASCCRKSGVTSGSKQM